jgi:hypothetical protein|tara:strand:- start:12355 stop:13293 length:939 start_codon:yes stop_codon:yes gene_type:complete
MGFFKKIFKGLKKVVKKVGRGIKKVVGKVSRAFGKLGVVGQLGMMFLMPYAMSGLSSMWASFGKFASGASGAFGKVMQGIHAAGSAVGNVYTSVTNAISNGIDRAGNFLQGEGFTLSEGRTSVFTPKGDDVVARSDAGVIKDVTEVKPPKSSLDEVLESVTRIDEKGMVTQATAKPFEMEQLPDLVGTKETLDKSLLEKGADFISEASGKLIADITDPEQVGAQLSSSVLSGAGQRVAYDIAGEPPVQRFINISPMDIQIAQQPDVFSQVDFSKANNIFSNMGSSFKGVSDIYADYWAQQDKTFQSLRYGGS